MFGVKADESDKKWAKLDLATFGAVKLVKLLEKIGIPVFKGTTDIIEDVDILLNLRSGISTTNKQLKNEKKKKR